MENLKEKSGFQSITVLVMILEAIVLAGIISYLAVNANQPEPDTRIDYTDGGKYVLYIGLNDKDTYEQIIATEEAKKIVNDICVKYVDGYTVSEVNGGWVDETGALTEEVSLMYMFSEAGEAEVIAIMDEVLTALNQNSILIERQDFSYAYYNRQ